jgi:hypothetical protein
MKKSMMLLIVAVFLLLNFSKHIQQIEDKMIEDINEVNEISYVSYIHLLKEDPLLKAIAFVESSYNTDAINKNDGGTGLLQITPIMVYDINRINRLRGDSTTYSLEDRLDPYKSIEMYYIFNDYYNHSHPEEIARAWNSGPKWYTKTHKTDRYWEKVQERLDFAP